MTSKAILGCAAFVLFFSAPFSSGAANWNPLPDTGQTTCYDADGNEITCPAEGEPFYGQDASYQGAAPSFTDNGDGTVTDNNTGLIWEKRNHTTFMSWYQAETFCTNRILAGSSDWRLPTFMEFIMIVSHHLHQFDWRTTVDNWRGFHMTATTDASNSANAWAIQFQSCVGGSYPKNHPYFYVVCVHD